MAEESTAVEETEDTTAAAAVVEQESDDTDIKGSADTIDWKKSSRKHETQWKKTAKENEELRAKLAEIENSNKSEQEKALAKAREEAAAETRQAFEQERRADRLEAAVTRLAAKPMKLGDDQVRFADPDDALLHVERAINRGEIDPDDIFDSDGKVQPAALTDALVELLTSKPHLREQPHGRVLGDADAGKGAGVKGLEDLSVDEHLKRQRKTA